MGKHKYSKALGFLHILQFSISRVIESHTITKTWENWILIVREKYGKTQTFQGYRSLTNFMWGVNPFHSQNMANANSYSEEKIWENTDISKLKVCYIFCLRQKPVYFTKHGKRGFS